MAYALKSNQIGVDALTQEPSFGNPPRNVPEKVIKSDDQAQERIARQHLDQAIELYETALTLAPDDVLVRLGYGWSLERRERKSDAIAQYRRVIDQAWERDKDLNAIGPFGEPVTAETIDYLVELLDPEKDAGEIEALGKRRQRFDRLPRLITPIAIPLRDGLVAGDLVDPAVSVHFDADGSGLARDWTWISRDVGWLVWDPTGRGSISSGRQLFGNVTFWLFWPTGYEALRALDDDGDGELRGKELAGLAVWRDFNQNGLSEAGEVEPLSSLGIVALSCSYRRAASRELAAFSPRGVTFQDGATRPSYDLVLRHDEHRLTQ